MELLTGYLFGEDLCYGRGTVVQSLKTEISEEIFQSYSRGKRGPLVTNKNLETKNSRWGRGLMGKNERQDIKENPQVCMKRERPQTFRFPLSFLNSLLFRLLLEKIKIKKIIIQNESLIVRKLRKFGIESSCRRVLQSRGLLFCLSLTRNP